jgi:hypothetical protein
MVVTDYFLARWRHDTTPCSRRPSGCDRRRRDPAVGNRGASVDELPELIEPPAWHRDAACREFPDVTWFPVRGQTAAPAKAVCQRCLVAFECFTWALAQGSDLQGIWARSQRP